MLEINNVSKRYGEHIVIDDVSLKVAKGKLTAFIGPNGAGKSTLLGIISRLIDNDVGEIFLDKNEIKTWHRSDFAKKLSILKQSNGLAMKLTVRELVSFGRFPYSKGRLTSEDERIVDEALSFLGLETLAESLISDISGGQLQRAYIALVFAQDTDYILLDEPLNNLDMRYAVQMMQLIRRFVDELGKTVVIVVHDINFASCYADEIVALKDNKIFAKGMTNDVITTPLLEELYEMPIEIHEHNQKKICLYYG